MDKPYHYPGEELFLFEGARNWKTYFSNKIKPFIGKNVLEVGAGIGATTKILNDGSPNAWTLLEPDGSMVQQLIETQASFPGNIVIQHGDINTLQEKNFDTILYIDVLEHIENDKIELERITEHLTTKGHLIILSPAFNFLSSEFDKAVGHYKRYKKKNLEKIKPDLLKTVSVLYLDSLGFFASAVNKIFLHQPYPTKKQVRFWDQYLIPASKIIDPIFFYSFGKTILAIWQKK